MKKFLFTFLYFFCFQIIFGQNSEKQISIPDDTVWYDGNIFTIEGMGWNETSEPYDRLPKSAELKVSKDVWKLSHHSAGINIRFLTNSPFIKIKWQLKNEMLSMPHMPATGVSGIDLYKKNENNKWFYAGTGRANVFPINTAKFYNDDSGKVPIEFLVYLPLYNGIKKIEIGIAKNKDIKSGNKNIKKPLVFYGTSITQGGCASRTGLVHTSIISRELDFPVINLGFSGSAKSEPEIADLLSELDASLYIYDPLRNMTTDLVKQNSEKFIRKLLELRPITPILMVSETDFKNRYPSERDSLFIKIVKTLNEEGFNNVYFLDGDGLLGYDGEATVDTNHPNDIGFQRMAAKFLKRIKEILNLE